jgi:hypothetical protein
MAWSWRASCRQSYDDLPSGSQMNRQHGSPVRRNDRAARLIVSRCRVDPGSRCHRASRSRWLRRDNPSATVRTSVCAIAMDRRPAATAWAGTMRQAQEPSPVPHHPRSSQYREPTPAVAVAAIRHPVAWKSGRWSVSRAWFQSLRLAIRCSRWLHDRENPPKAESAPGAPLCQQTPTRANTHSRLCPDCRRGPGVSPWWPTPSPGLPVWPARHRASRCA